VATVEYALSPSVTGVANSSRIVGLECKTVFDVHVVVVVVDEGSKGLVSLRHLCSCRFSKGNVAASSTCSRACSAPSDRVSKLYFVHETLMDARCLLEAAPLITTTDIAK
jgi:hypothetical protein